MSATNIALLGAIAGFTIFLGLPVGRLRNPAPRLRALLNAGAVGVLLFLLVEVMEHAWEPVEEGIEEHELGEALGTGLLLAAGLTVGLLGLVYFDRYIAKRRAATSTPAAVKVPASVGGAGAFPGEAGAGELAAPDARQAAGQLALLIAVGIGLHNFAEGLAIGNLAAADKIGLAVLLIVGFGLHNATEGFGIVAPLAATGSRPSWGYLGLLGLIGGGPTFLGTLVGQRFTNELVSVAFLALAAGSILYVIIELLAVGRRMATKEITTIGVLAGLALGFITDGILVSGGL